MEYIFKWKSGLLTRSRVVVGHRYDQEQGKMVLYFANGAVEEIPNWKNCAIRLGIDWVIAEKKSMEQRSGSVIPLSTVKA